jgi:hypothetical protein
LTTKVDGGEASQQPSTMGDQFPALELLQRLRAEQFLAQEDQDKYDGDNDDWKVDRETPAPGCRREITTDDGADAEGHSRDYGEEGPVDGQFAE